jgi:23S rRNA pseudouridine1911/1915/1917 synthase
MNPAADPCTEEGFRLTVGSDGAGARLDKFISSRLETFTRSAVQRSIRLGQVTVDEITAYKTGLAVREGQEVLFVPPPKEPTRAEPETIPLDVLLEDEHIVVLNKTAGMVVHPAAGHPNGTLVNALLGRYPDLGREEGLRPGIVHRLDRGTSGAMVVARTEKARESLSEQFLRHEVFKGYLAILRGRRREDAGRIERPIGRHPTDRKRFSSRGGEGRAALTLWRKLEAVPEATLAAIRILTGRTHQIRVHMADDGYPVAGDDLYGGGCAPTPICGSARTRDAEGTLRPFLHAALLRFSHPASGVALTSCAPLPQPFRSAVQALFPGYLPELEAGMSRPDFYPQE